MIQRLEPYPGRRRSKDTLHAALDHCRVNSARHVTRAHARVATTLDNPQHREVHRFLMNGTRNSLGLHSNVKFCDFSVRAESSEPAGSQVAAATWDGSLRLSLGAALLAQPGGVERALGFDNPGAFSAWQGGRCPPLNKAGASSRNPYTRWNESV